MPEIKSVFLSFAQRHSSVHCLMDTQPNDLHRRSGRRPYQRTRWRGTVCGTRAVGSGGAARQRHHPGQRRCACGGPGLALSAPRRGTAPVPWRGAAAAQRGPHLQDSGLHAARQPGCRGAGRTRRGGPPAGRSGAGLSGRRPHHRAGPAARAGHAAGAHGVCERPAHPRHHQQCGRAHARPAAGLHAGARRRARPRPGRHRRRRGLATARRAVGGLARPGGSAGPRTARHARARHPGQARSRGRTPASHPSTPALQARAGHPGLAGACW